ncbi:MAG: magnesium protoporphyrin IX methyltransferase [Myxococcota bacterium]
MKTLTYQRRRSQLETYFDRTAVDAWTRLTSDRPVSRIRATVRAGRDRMRSILLDGLPEDLKGCRLLDAGCGTGALSVAAAERGADVVAIDLSPTLIKVARERLPAQLGDGKIEFRVGDMVDPSLGKFDYVVAMDSIIHYRAEDMVAMIANMADLAERKVLFTFAPRSILLTLMHLAGRLFPRSDRAPSIEPIRERTLRRKIGAHADLERWQITGSERVSSGFYTSQSMELTRS